MDKFIKMIYRLLALLVVGQVAACGDGDEPQPTDKEVERTVLVYMVADNATNSLGLAGNDAADMEEMAVAARNGALGNGRLLVYHAAAGTDNGVAPELKELDRHGKWTTLKVYPTGGGVTSVDVGRMRQVLTDVRDVAPAAGYGLVLWSHATGWDETPTTRSFGDDRGHTMNIPSLAEALDGFDHEYIYFDCCLMATVEVVYELRHATGTIIASGTELHADGMPYQLTLGPLMAVPFDAGTTARATFNHYNSLQGADRMCTISVISTAAADRLAAATRDIMEQGPRLTLNGQQSYRPGFYTLYDMARFIDGLDVDDALKQRWHTEFDSVVTLALATETILGYFPIETYCGLGTYIPLSPLDTGYRGYDTLGWWRDVVSANPGLQPDNQRQ